MKVNFKVIEVCDTAKTGSEVKEGAVLTGELNELRNRIQFTDAAGCDWIFYPGDTAEILD